MKQCIKVEENHYSADRPFGDTVMRKDVMVNSSLTPDDISDLLEDYEY